MNQPPPRPRSHEAYVATLHCTKCGRKLERHEEARKLHDPATGETLPPKASYRCPMFPSRWWHVWTEHRFHDAFDAESGFKIGFI